MKNVKLYKGNYMHFGLHLQKKGLELKEPRLFIHYDNFDPLPTFSWMKKTVTSLFKV